MADLTLDLTPAYLAGARSSPTNIPGAYILRDNMERERVAIDCVSENHRDSIGPGCPPFPNDVCVGKGCCYWCETVYTDRSSSRVDNDDGGTDGVHLSIIRANQPNRCLRLHCALPLRELRSERRLSGSDYRHCPQKHSAQHYTQRIHSIVLQQILQIWVAFYNT